MYSTEPIIELRPFDDNEWTFHTPRLNLEAHDRLDEAIELWREGDLQESERLFRLLILEYSEFIDAYHHLAMILDETGRKQEAFQIWQKAVQLTFDCFISTFCDDGKQLPWGVIDNRPFLRAYHGLGLMHLRSGEVQKALSIFSNILRMNPNDNQGVRALAIDCYFNLNSPQKVLDVCHDYPDDTDESVMYGKVLALFQIDKKDEAGEALRDAVNTLPLIAKELIKRNHIKPKNLRRGYITFGGQDQAYYYWVSQGKYWRTTPGAIDFVKEWLDKHRK
jgi:tetratricopeptide (TPR) repeat protein